MRWLVPFLIVGAGCVLTLPADDRTITADIATEAAYATVKARQEMHPSPTPESDDCENCIDGYVGDGRIKVKCQVCDGTGKRPKSVCKDCPK